MADGKVTLDTGLDNSGVKKDAAEMSEVVKAEYQKAGEEAANAFAKACESTASTMPVIDLDTGQVTEAAQVAVSAANEATQAGQSAVDTAQKATAAAAQASASLGSTAQAVGEVTTSVSAQDQKVQDILADTERSAKSKAASIAAVYHQQGLSQQEAMKRAWDQIERTSDKSSQKVGENIRGSIGGALEEVVGKFGGLNSVVKTLATTVATVFSMQQIVKFAVDSSKAAMSLSDALTGLRSILEGQGKSFNAAQAFIEDYTSDGLIPATNAITAYKNLAARGYDDSQIQKVMLALKDASAYGRQASYTMGEAVQSATEGLKNENSILVDNAGVTKNVAKMWEEYAASIGTTANNLTQEQKIQAEVNGILEESKYQSGDAATVANTLSGQLQQLSFNFNNLKVAIGNAINPIVQAFLPIINTAISAVVRFANAVASVVGMLFGNASASASNLAESNNAVAASAAAGTEAEQELADATEAAGKAAKKSLAGFDELNKLQGDSGGASSAVSAGGFSAGSVAVEADVEDAVSPKVEALIEKIRGFGATIKTAFQPSITAWGEAFSGLGSSIESAGSRIGTAWTTLKDTALVPFGTYITTDFIPSIANDFSTTFAPIFADVMPVAMDIWATDFENSCLLIQEYCGILQLAYEGVKTVFSDMCESISSNWDTYGGDLLQGFTDFKDGLWETWWYIYENIIDPVITACSETLSWLWDEHLKPLWDDIVEFALSVSENILALWNGFLKPIIDWLITILAPIVTNVINGIVDAVAIVIAVVSDVIGGVLTFLDGLIQFIVGVFTLDWERAWGGIIKMFEGLWNGLSGIVKGVVNAVIWVINQLVAAIYSGIAGIVNGLGGIVDTVGDILGQDWGFSIPTAAPKIPYLAQGAVLPANKPFLAMVGDQKHGTNVEAPLETIQEAVAMVMEDMTGGMMAGFEATVAVLKEILEAIYGIEIGDEVIAKAAQRYQAKMAIVKRGG